MPGPKRGHKLAQPNTPGPKGRKKPSWASPQCAWGDRDLSYQSRGLRIRFAVACSDEIWQRLCECIEQWESASRWESVLESISQGHLSQKGKRRLWEREGKEGAETVNREKNSERRRQFGERLICTALTKKIQEGLIGASCYSLTPLLTWHTTHKEMIQTHSQTEFIQRKRTCRSWPAANVHKDQTCGWSPRPR